MLATNDSIILITRKQYTLSNGKWAFTKCYIKKKSQSTKDYTRADVNSMSAGMFKEGRQLFI